MSAKDLQEALRFQLVHRDLLLGDICVLLGFTPRWIKDAAVAKQTAATSGAVALMQLARERTHRLNSSIGGLEAVIRRAEEDLE